MAAKENLVLPDSAKWPNRKNPEYIPVTVRGGARDDSSDYNKQTYN
jgi:hypothetical protein